MSDVALAGDYAAFANSWGNRYSGFGSAVTVFDLRTGAVVPGRGSETVDDGTLDQLVLGADAVTALHTTTINCAQPPACTTIEQIVANDSAGTRTLDTATTTVPYGGATTSLTGLTLTGDTLTWNHAGTQRTAQLQG